MIRRILMLVCIIPLLTACDQATLQKALETATDLLDTPLTQEQIGNGLKEALEVGVSKGSDLLSQKDGYYKSAYKILLPPEAQKITAKLQNIPGFSKVEDVILEKINRGAEDAAKQAKPIFVDAIKAMSFRDATQILMGDKNAATSYLHTNTNTKLQAAFNPVIVESLDKFEARKYWSDAVNAYNKIPFVQKANPNLEEYVTNQALTGLFSMVEKKELDIRENVTARTSDLLKKVFAKQDGQ